MARSARVLWASCFLRPLMTIDTADHAVTQALGAHAKAENLKAIAELSATAEHQAAHIRGIVAATMAQLSYGATQATQDSAAQWQEWALSLSDALPTPAIAP
jgi:hypothetical protein